MLLIFVEITRPPVWRLPVNASGRAAGALHPGFEVPLMSVRVITPTAFSLACVTLPDFGIAMILPLRMVQAKANSATRSHTLCTRSSRCDDSSTETPSRLRTADHVEQLDRRLRVEAGGRLVEDRDRRLLHQDLGRGRGAGACRARRWRRGCRRPRSRSTRSSAVGDPRVALGLAAARRGAPYSADCRAPSDSRRSRPNRHVADPPLHRERLAHRIVAEHARLGRPVISVSPSSIRIVVVLPAPFGPSRPKISPRATRERDMPSTAAVPS